MLADVFTFVLKYILILEECRELNILLRCRQNRKCGNFKSLLCGGRHRIVLKSAPHVQHAYFSSFDQSNSKFVACYHSFHIC